MAPSSRVLALGLLGSTAISLAFASVAQAQETYGFSLDPIIVEIRDENAGDAEKSSSVYVADAELERARMGDLKDVFAGIASVSVGGAIPVAQKIYVNGVDMLNLGVQVDGVSQNNRVFHHASSNAFDPGLMKSVRVDPGVAPADAGPRALAGRVVIETVDAPDILDAGDTFGGNIRLSFGDNGNTFGRSFTVASQQGGFEILAYGKSVTGNNFNDGDGTEIAGTASDLQAGLLKLAYESDEGHRVEFSGQVVNDKELRNRRANFGVAGWNPTSNIYDTKRAVYSFRYENVNGGGMWDPSVTLGFSETDLASISASETWRGVSNTTSFVAQNKFHLSDVDSITAGVDFQRRKTDATGDFHSGDPLTSNNPFELSENLGLFAQARLEPTQNLKVSGGIRYDWQDFTGQDFALTGAHREKTSGASGNLSVEYAATDSLSLRAGYSNVFGGFDLDDNFLFYQAFDYSGLKASRAKNFVVGADWEYGAWTLGAEAFKTQINDARNFTLTDKSTVTSNDFESKGFNLGATYNWHEGFARFTYTNSEITIDGAPASHTAAVDLGAPVGQVLALEAQQELPSLNLLVGGSVEAALKYDHGADDLPAGWASPITMEPYTVLNLFAEYTPPSYKNVAIRAAINNVFDTTYADRTTYGSDSSEVNTLKEPGRTVSLIVTAKF